MQKLCPAAALLRYFTNSLLLHMRNYVPWSPEIITAILENYQYDPVLGHITSRKRFSLPMGTECAGGLQLFMYIKGGGSKGLAAHRVAVLLKTGKQPDTVWFADGNRKNLKWENLRFSNSEFPSTPAGGSADEIKFHMSVMEMGHIQGLREALRVGGYKEDEKLPDFTDMSAIQLLRWAKTSRHHSTELDNPKNYLESSVWMSRYGDEQGNLKVEVPATLTPADAPVQTQAKVTQVKDIETKQLFWRKSLLTAKNKFGVDISLCSRESLINDAKFKPDDGSGVTLEDIITSLS